MKIGQHLRKLWAIKYRVVFFKNETQCKRYIYNYRNLGDQAITNKNVLYIQIANLVHAGYWLHFLYICNLETKSGKSLTLNNSIK